MPNIVQGAATEEVAFSQDVKRGEYRGRYPNGLDLNPSSDLHKKLVNLVMEKARIAHHRLREKFPEWEKIDDSLTAFVDLSEAEEDVKSADERKPVSIVIPLSYATLETLLTYFAAVFLQDPVFQYGPREPRDIIKAAKMEYLVQYQVELGKMALGLHTQWRDAFSYGFGLAAPEFIRDYAYKTVKKKMSMWSNLMRVFVEGPMQEIRQRVVRYEGNVLNSIDPYLSLPDPNVAIHNLQRGEFFGWIERTNYYDCWRKSEIVKMSSM